MAEKALERMNEKEKKATRQAYGEVLRELGEKYPELVVLDADLSKSTMTNEFRKVYPERFFNLGIAEQNMLGFAAGLALSGKKVCCSGFATFVSGRAFEIIRNAIGYTHLDVNICATHAGITVGEDGATHQSFEDIALMRTIPGMTVVCPSDEVSTRELMRQALALKGPVYMRLGRAAVPSVYDEGEKIELGKGRVLRDGKDVALIATGIMVNEALIAAEELAKDGIEARVIDIHTIKPLDKELIVKAARECRFVVTCEEHSIIGGLGGAVAECLVESEPVPMAFVGQCDTFGESGKPDELKAKYGMNAAAITEAVARLKG